ncbi:hypothetical protein LDO31_10095 [Luteimonas sp. XNQY3]|nr:hypothetical protein [Luteimonas sp. XNQY3]MCD9006580.1 hypothetical protein [Luteimonas sp. XNQY3]
MTAPAGTWLMPTPQGVLHAFGGSEPDAMQSALQALLAADHALPLDVWSSAVVDADLVLAQARERGWMELMRRPVPGPDVRLDDFAQHVIAPLSGERRAVLASDGGFRLGHAGIGQDEADTLSVAAADFSAFARRQGARGWKGAERYVSFFSEPTLLMPDWSFVPFWVDGAGYWLVVAGEPLLNNLAMVELVWSIRLASNRFQTG